MGLRIQKEKVMNCVVCKSGTTTLGTTTVTLERGATVVVVRHVPAHVCDNCGEVYLENDASKQVMEIAQAAVASGTVVQIQEYRAA